jgi:hypothetical protein
MVAGRTTVVSTLAFLAFSSIAPAQEIGKAQFAALAKECRDRSSAPTSERARIIKDIAEKQHTAFVGNRVDHSGRMLVFGHAESESDQEIEGKVTSQQIPWRQVLGYWELLAKKNISEAAHSALEVWYYPGVLDEMPPNVLNRNKIKVERLIDAIGDLDFSKHGEQASDIKAALTQSVIRSGISDVAWSAAFISATMRSAKLIGNSEFNYDASHVAYIASSVKQSLNDIGPKGDNHFYRACDPDTTKPRTGDLYCYHRHVAGTKNPYEPNKGLSLFRSLFVDIATGKEPISRSHCDIVVRIDVPAKKVIVIGGNVQNSVTQKTLNLNQDGYLSVSQGTKECEGFNPDKPGSDVPNCNLNSQKWFTLLQAQPKPL